MIAVAISATVALLSGLAITHFKQHSDARLISPNGLVPINLCVRERILQLVVVTVGLASGASRDVR